jgi:hypothetical protein
MNTKTDSQPTDSSEAKQGGGGGNIAQIMPSTDEATCRELARLINLGASICETND